MESFPHCITDSTPSHLPPLLLQAYFRDIVGLVPDHHKKVSHNLFAGGGSCLQFVKTATSMKCNEAKHNKRRHAYKTTFVITLGSSG